MSEQLASPPARAWPDWLQPGPSGFVHPADESEIITIVKFAKANGLQVRVVGSQHSVVGAIFSDNFLQASDTRDGINLLLNRLNQVTIDTTTKTVRVQAGCTLGFNPYDPTNTSTLENSLFWQLNHQGLGFPLSGGITLQTVAGFLSTGSSGGSRSYSVGEKVLAIRLVDGNGDVHVLSRESDPDTFHAAGVSLGLLGVIIEVTLQCIDQFYIGGSEVVSPAADCSVDLFGSGTPDKPALADFFRDQKYARLEWWPQQGVDKVALWQANPLTPDEVALHSVNGIFHPKPYEAMPWTKVPIVGLATPLPIEILTGDLLWLINTWPQWLKIIFQGAYDDQTMLQAAAQAMVSLLHLLRPAGPAAAEDSDVTQAIDALKSISGSGDLKTAFIKLLGPTIEQYGLKTVEIASLDAVRATIEGETLLGFLERLAEDLFAPVILPAIFNGFLPDTTTSPQVFWDVWWHGIPMDLQFDYNLIPVGFCEIWLAIDDAERVMQALQQHYAANGLAASGTFCAEIYSARQSEFWLSPSFPGDALRLDLYWYERSRQDPRLSYFPQFWKLFYDLKIDFRFHWGKYLPPPQVGLAGPGTPTFAEYARTQYAHWDDFLTIRHQLDPAGVFLTRYWRDHLGITI